MSKFSHGDLVKVIGNNLLTTGVVSETWSNRIGKSGMPLVGVFLDSSTGVAYYEEHELALNLDEYEFMAVEVDLEDGFQTSLGSGWEWTSLDYAKQQIEDALVRDANYYADEMDSVMLQINRRRKAGPTIGHKAYRWNGWGDE